MLVPPVGPRKARIYLVGEAPGVEEDLSGKPFVGGAGRVLNSLLMEAGISRSECRIGNLSQIRPPGNKFAKLDPSQLGKDVSALKWDIIETSPNVTILLGDNPLQHIVGEKGISHWRGSVLWSETLKTKLLPTYHPSYIMRGNWKEAPLVVLDLKKALEESKSKEYNTADYNLVLAPTLAEVITRLNEAALAKEVSFDIETARNTALILSIAFAWRTGPGPDDITSICIPFTRGDIPYWTEQDELEVIMRVKALLESPDVWKTAQNAQFDMCVLNYKYGIKVSPLRVDTMCGFHTMYPELPKDLGTLTSIYTNHPYYKHWSASDFWKYNATDAAVTLPIGEQVVEEMQDWHVWDYYSERIHPLIGELIEVQKKGVLISQPVLAPIREKYESRLKIAQEKLDYIAERPINVNSPKQMQDFLYNDMGLPTKTNRKTGRPTANEEALRELAVSNPSPIFDLILDIRASVKMLSTYLSPTLISADGRMHFSFNIGGTLKDQETGRVVSGPTSGRLSSSRSIIFDSGTNGQNIPHGDIRRAFIPDPGYDWWKVDLSQAESRVVAWLANEEWLIDAYLRGEDIHTLNACWIFECEKEEITKEMRYFAKKHVHAFNYGESPYSFAKLSRIPVKGMGENVSKPITVSEAKAIQDKYFSIAPRIRLWQQKIDYTLKKNRIMESPFGWKRVFFGRYDSAMLREAYSFVPQNVVAVVCNTALVNLARLFREKGEDASILLQVHDELDFQARTDRRAEVEQLVNEAFDIHIPNLPGGDLVIPHEMAVGPNWEDAKEI